MFMLKILLRIRVKKSYKIGWSFREQNIKYNHTMISPQDPVTRAPECSIKMAFLTFSRKNLAKAPFGKNINLAFDGGGGAADSVQLFSELFYSQN